MNEEELMQDRMVTEDMKDALMVQQAQQAQLAQTDYLVRDGLQYKVMRIVPDAARDFRGRIDKDVTLANLDGKLPTIQELAFVNETIELLEGILVEDTFLPIMNDNGEYLRDGQGRILTRQVAVFDKTFEPIRKALLTTFKFKLSASRAKGKDREAILDKMTISSLHKNLERKREERFRMGGG